MKEQMEAPLDTLKEIRSMMERSARFLSLSGWSGIWAGSVALVGAGLAYSLLKDFNRETAQEPIEKLLFTSSLLQSLVLLALAVFFTAVAGGYYFTYRKNRKAGVSIWNTASRKMIINLAIPLGAGGAFVFALLLHGNWEYISSACLVFYGLALINGSKYTVSDIKYLGLLETVIGCAGLFIPSGYGLYLWALGFGALHIVYGVIMWRKYEL